MQCPKCSAPIETDGRFCGRCGQKIDAGVSAPPPPASQPAFAGIGSIPAAAAGTPASSTAPLVERIKNIILQPKFEWPVIASEPTSIAQLYTGYVMPLAGVAAVLSFLHVSVIGVHIPFGGTLRMPVSSGLTAAIFSFVGALIGLFLVGLIINALAPTFAGTSDRRQALKVATYAFTPGWLASLLALSPVMPMLLQWIAFFYGIYLLYLGLPVVMRSPKERAFGYTATVVVCTILLGIVFAGLSMLAGRFGLAPAGLSSSPAAQAAAQAAAQDQGAAAVGNILGNALGTDAKGKEGLSAALSNLAKAGSPGDAPATPTSTATTSTAAASAPTSATANSSDAQGGTPAAAAPNAVSAVAGLATALGGALGGSHRVAVVDPKTLTALLPPSLPGMKRTDAQSETQAAVGVKTSSAKAVYQGDDGAEVHIEISDISAVSGLIDTASSLVQNTTSESASGFERDQIISGRAVHEKYDATAKKGDLSVILAKRFEVDVAGDGVDMNTLEKSLAQIDLARLESMKDQGAQAQ
jgi:hypothetical protein